MLQINLASSALSIICNWIRITLSVIPMEPSNFEKKIYQIQINSWYDRRVRNSTISGTDTEVVKKCSRSSIAYFCPIVAQCLLMQPKEFSHENRTLIISLLRKPTKILFSFLKREGHRIGQISDHSPTQIAPKLVSLFI